MLTGAVRALLRNATGLDLDQVSVNKAVRARMQAWGDAQVEVYAARVRPGSDELDALIDEVVVPETWFFREPEAFAAACRVVEEKRAAGTFPVRVLCLPCATGEEPYSLAIALLERGIPHTDFLIQGMDVSKAALQRARRALYQRNAFRGTASGFRERYFKEDEDGYALLPRVRELVEFRRANLFELVAPPSHETYDIIFCRNLLIYFDEATQREAVLQLQKLLRAGGVLFSGHAEVPTFCRHGFATIPLTRAFALIRREQQEPRPLAGLQLHPPRPLCSLPPPPSSAVSARQAAAPSARPSAAPDGDAAGLMERARALADQGQLEDATKLFRRCVQLAPECAEGHFMLGLLSERMQDLPAAEEWLRRAVYLDPEHYEALCHLALLRERHGEDVHAHALRRRAARVYQRRQEGGMGR